MDPEQLRGEIDTLRTEAEPAKQDRAAWIEEVRQVKERAIKSRDFQTASRMGDQERQLRQARRR